MARPLRIAYPGAFYHVISRGHAGDPIFKTRLEREKFIEYLATAVEHFGIRIHTYCLMTDHYHLLLETPEPNLSRAIQWLNVCYATHVNHKRGRRGHLFYGRFKSILVDADGYLKHLSRYIHLNPLRDSVVEAAADYEWSSYPAFIGDITAPEWLSVRRILVQFGGKHEIAQRKYRQFVERADIKTLKNPANKIASGLILGDEAFVKSITSSGLSVRSSDPDLPQPNQLSSRCSLDRIIEIVADAFDSTKAQILKKGRKNNLARDMAIYFSKAYSGKTGIEIALCYGLRSASAVTMRSKMALKVMAGRRELDRKLKRIKEQIRNN